MADNYVLVGFMGAGKTSVGKMLAAETGKKFMDTDELIVQQMGLSINDIFAQYGEEYFRNLETNLLKALCDTAHDAVISVGGGLPVREENRKYMKELGTVVYLSTTESTVIKRLKGDTTRPLLRGTKEEVKAKVHDLMSKRRDLYKDAAHLVIETDKLKKDEVVAKIVSYKK